MLKIVNINIKRYRSILELVLPIQENNIVALCGKNNVGKTNTLRAINLFFNPDLYNIQHDMPKIKHATGGQSIYPKIELTFKDSDTNKYYVITRDIKNHLNGYSDLIGKSYELNGKRKVNKIEIEEQEINNILDKIEFVYIESINVFIPELIKNLTEDMIDVQYDKSRFTESKRKLKESYDAYVEGLEEILGSFAKEISSIFREFQSDWSVKFIVPKNSNSVRELISKDVSLTLDDSGSQGVIEKGSGLQRLATILLTFEMLSRIKKRKELIICIDEPDIYLHEGLQRKLNDFFEEKSKTMQLFYTTHSKVFINAYNMKNVFLLEAKRYNKFSKRKNKEITVTETYNVDINAEEGYNKICNHLGIERLNYELLERDNILVEGNCDKNYLEKLAKYFGINIPYIESLNGADNAINYLEFYDSYYKNIELSYKPKIKLLLDNDSKGREIFKKVDSKKYDNIIVKTVILQNYLGNADLSIEKNSTNNEIEDFIYPELLCYLINELLKKKGMEKIKVKDVCKKIKQKSFFSRGILELCENEKNTYNPEKGADISFVSSGKSTCKAKESLSGMFNIEANKTLQNLLEKCNEKYPNVKKELESLCDFKDVTE